jgi:hypothetical protein
MFSLIQKDNPYRVEYIYETISSIQTVLTYKEWMEDGSTLSDPFEMHILEKLKFCIEKNRTESV